MRSKNHLATEARDLARDLARARAARERREQQALRAEARRRHIAHMNSEAYYDAESRRAMLKWLSIMCLGAAAFLAIAFFAGCSNAGAYPVCHARLSVNNTSNYRVDADATNAAWCEQLKDAAHLLNVQLFTGAGDDALRVSLEDDFASEPISGEAGTATTGAVWLDIDAYHCHDFRGTLRSSPPPDWKVEISAVSNTGDMTLEATLWGVMP